MSEQETYTQTEMKRFELDLERFWAENAISLSVDCFSTDKPRAAILLPVDDHWLFDEMKVPSTVRYYKDLDYRLELHRRCNDRCQREIGIRPFPEAILWPPPKRIEEVFGSYQVFTEGATPWLEPAVETIEDLVRIMDQVERMDMADFIFQDGVPDFPDAPPPDAEKPPRRMSSRGPATIGTSVCGTERYLYFLIDHPAEMQRFHELLAQKLVEYAHIMADAMGVTPRGYSFLDDNCALLSPELYERFCAPVLQYVFDHLAPDADDWRYQHSDSAMDHLLPILARFNFTAVNFGPTVRAIDIRRHMPRTCIHGQVAPMTLRNAPYEAIIAEVRRDFEAVGRDGGLVITTAGSIAAGTTFDRIRCFMWAVDRYARYDGKTFDDAA
ncbi:MAG TPA: uroporphyrinogen III decarboxylase [Caldilineae bacterium]|nr:uroporphyrinogen III decarboxylase [Caldilineae bacterium]